MHNSYLKNKADQLTGVVILVGRKGILPWGIKKFMQWEGLLTGEADYKPPENHSGILINYKGKLQVFEAIKEGEVIRPIEESLDHATSITLLRPKPPLDEDEKEKLIQYCEKRVKEGHKYQVMNFIQWIFFIRSRHAEKKGLWVGRRKKKRAIKTYCYECTARAMNAARGGLAWWDPEITSIWKYYNHPDLVELSPIELEWFLDEVKIMTLMGC